MRKSLAIMFVAMALSTALSTQLAASVQSGTSANSAMFSGSYASIGFPAYVKPVMFRDTAFTIENTGDQDLTYAITTFETSGPSGWLTISGFSGLVPFGVGNTETGNFRLNATSFVPSPVGTIVLCKGGVVFTSNAPSSPDTVPITIYITDTVIVPDWDTIYVTSASKATNRKGLTVSNTGGLGNAGAGKVNLDFADWNDCVPTANVYLHEGSVVVGYVSGTDTNMYYNMLGSNWLSETGLRPVKGAIASKVKTCTSQNYNLAYSGRFTTADTNITMEKTWYAPILAGTGTVDSAWMIQCLKVYNTSGATISNLVVGEISDWNIPSDSGNQNSSGFNLIKNLIYQQGGEFDDVGECQDNNARFGAVRYLGGYKKTGAGAPTTIANPSGAYTKENSIDIYPTGTFVEGDIFTSMQAIGFAVTDSVTDLHTVMTFRKNETLGTFDTLRFYTAWLTVGNGDTTSLYTMADRALNWYTAKSISQLSDTLCGIACCCVKVGDFDHSGSIGVVDVTKFVARLFQGGLPPVCFDEVDINNDGKFNIVDLTLLVQRLFGGGPYVPCQCG